MESMAVAPGFARAIAGTGPVFAAFLVPHILAGLTGRHRGRADRDPRACRSGRWLPADPGPTAGAIAIWRPR
jgi:hypothetical protein